MNTSSFGFRWTRPPARRNFGVNSSRTVRFVISISDLIEELKPYESVFFFYKDGLVDAVKTVLSTFVYPTQRLDGWNVHGANPILHDLEMCFDALERDNCLPPNHADMLDLLEIAVSQVDEAVYAELKKYLGDRDVRCFNAEFINSRHDCLICAEW